MAGITLGVSGGMCSRFLLGVVGKIRCAGSVASRTIVCRCRGVCPGMVHRARNKTDETIVVTGIALRPCWNVSDGLGEGIGRNETAAVTSRTKGGSAGVVHAGWLETHIVAVACIALSRARNVGTWFAKRSASIVAGRTIADGTGRMNELGAHPGYVTPGMASITLSIGQYVCCRLGQGVGEQITAAMATRTVAHCYRPSGAGMVHYVGLPERRERGRAVAGIALSAGWNVSRRLA